MTDFEQLIAQFEQQRGQKLTPAELAGCKEFWETTLKPQLQQQESDGQNSQIDSRLHRA